MLGELSDYGPVITADRVRTTSEGVKIGALRHDDDHGEPKVQLVREDGVIRAIDVTCACGEKIRIRCDYS